MRLSLLQLESRDAPAADLGGGVLRLSVGHEVQPFADWHGPLNSEASGTGLVYVGPRDGGGPRVAVFNADGSRAQPDFFAADPGSRAGVVFVSMADGRAEKSPTVADVPPFVAPDLTYGNAADPNTWRVYVDFQNPASTEWVKNVLGEMWRVMQPLGNVALVTRRPADYPGNYGTIVIGADLSFVGDQGATVARWDEPHSNWDSGGVYVDCRDILPGFPVDPVEVGQIAAHEAGHAMGLAHDTAPGSVMRFGHVEPGQTYTPQDLLTARAAAARAVSLEYHATPAGVA